MCLPADPISRAVQRQDPVAKALGISDSIDKVTGKLDPIGNSVAKHVTGSGGSPRPQGSGSNLTISKGLR